VIRFLLLSGIASGGIIINSLPNILYKTSTNQAINFNLKQTTIVTHVSGNLSSDISFSVLPKNIRIPNDFNGYIPIADAIEYLKDGYDTNTSGCWNRTLGFGVGMAKALTSNNLRFDWSQALLNDMYMDVSGKVSIKSKIVLGMNEWFKNIHSNVLYSKNNDDQFLFTDYNELMNFIPNDVENVNLGKAITSMDTIAVTYINSTDDYFSFHYIEPDSIDLTIPINNYSLKEMINENDDLNGDFSILLKDGDSILNNTNFNLIYNCDGYNMEQNVTYNELVNGINYKYFSNFQPISLTLNDYCDSNTFIKGQIISL